MYQKVKEKKFCQDCGMPCSYHLQTWIQGLIDCLPLSFFSNLIPQKIELRAQALIEKLFILLKFVSIQNNFTPFDVSLRSACFINEAKKHNLKIKALRGRFGYTDHFQMQVKEKTFCFEGLPLAEFLSRRNIQDIDNKGLVKKRLKRGDFPVAKGRSFWFWQKKKACSWTNNQLKFPVVVKPQSGSFSRHVFTDIRNDGQLKQAINKVLKYSPNFIVEEFISSTFVYRATVIDFNFIACAKRIEANVIGDGEHSIRELVNAKNDNPLRGSSRGNESVLCKIIIDKTTRELLEKKNYNFSTIPPKGEVVWLQKDPFIRLGGDVIEVTEKIHPDNVQFFQKLAKFFDVRVVGIDLLAQDITQSWKIQPCAILELNSLPCIEIHHFPCSGKPQNVAKALVNMVLKYY